MKLTERSDESLLRAFVDETESQALDTLIARHWERAFRLAVRVLRDPHAAEDVAQETFVKVARSAATFERERAFAPWLYAIVLNTARTAQRAKRRRARHEATAAAAVAGRQLAGAPVAGTSIEDHLASLPEELRAPLALRYGEELTLEEVAQALRCPVGTASSRIRRGLDQLRNSGVAMTALTDFLRAPVATPPAPPSSAILSRVARARLALLSNAAVVLVATFAIAALVLPSVRAATPPAANPVAQAPLDAPAIAPEGSATVAALESGGAEPAADFKKTVVVTIADDQPASPPKAPADPTPTPASTRELRSRIVADEDGKPIEDARVTGFESAQGQQGWNQGMVGGSAHLLPSSSPFSVVRSGKDGRFELPLTRVTYPVRVVVTATGRVPLALVLEKEPDELRLHNGGIRLDGTVVAGDAAHPAPRVTVLLDQDGLERDTVSDAAGQFAFDDLAPGAATLRLENDDGEGKTTPVIVAPGKRVTLGLATQATIQVQGVGPNGDPVAIAASVDFGQGSQSTSGEATLSFKSLPCGEPVHVHVERARKDSLGTGVVDAYFDVTLECGETRKLTATIDTSRDGTIDALATDSHGAALAGAKLCLRRAPTRKYEFTGLGIEATAGANGHASFSVPAGSYQLFLDGRRASAPFDVAAREAKSAVAKSAGERTIGGRALDSDGKPLAEARVEVLDASDEDGSDSPTGQCDPAGRFTIKGLPDVFGAQATLVVRAQGFLTEFRPLASETALDAIEVKLEREPPQATVHVVVELPERATAPKRISIGLFGDQCRTNYEGSQLDSTLDGAKGSKVRVVVSAEGFAPFFGPTIELGKDLEVAVVYPMSVGRPIEGRVLDAAGAPIKGAYFAVAGVMTAVQSAADGSFVVPHAPLEAFAFEIEHEIYQAQRVTVPAGAAGPLLVTLSRR